MEKGYYLVPPVDIYETEDKYILVLDMPGARKEDIEISTEKDSLIVSGKVPEIDKEWKTVLSEFKLYDYKREFTIGNRVDADKIEAKYDNGVLTVELAKSEQVKPKKIEVKVA